jgi:hypothetical protein
MKEDRLMVVYFTKPQPVGTKMPEWYQHMTILPWLRGNVQLATKALRSLHDFNDEIFAVAQGEDYFGPNGEVHVKKIRPNPRLQQLHLALKGLVEFAGCHLEDETYAGENYQPHISLKPDQPPIPDGKAFFIDKLSVVQKINNTRLVKAQIDL